MLRGDTPFGGGQRWIEIVPHGVTTSLSLVTWFDQMPAGAAQGSVLCCDDIETTHAYPEARGVRFHGPVDEEVW